MDFASPGKRQLMPMIAMSSMVVQTCRGVCLDVGGAALGVGHRSRAGALEKHVVEVREDQWRQSQPGYHRKGHWRAKKRSECGRVKGPGVGAK